LWGILPADNNHSAKHTSLNDVTEPLVDDDDDDDKQLENFMTTMSMLAI